MGDNRVQMDLMFRWAIGERVVEAALLDQWRLDAELNPDPADYTRVTPMQGSVIVERHATQCHGGVQLFYRLRRYNGEGSSLITYTELELAPYAEAEKAARDLVARRQTEHKPSSKLAAALAAMGTAAAKKEE